MTYYTLFLSLIKILSKAPLSTVVVAYIVRISRMHKTVTPLPFLVSLTLTLFGSGLGSLVYKVDKSLVTGKSISDPVVPYLPSLALDLKIQKSARK